MDALLSRFRNLAVLLVAVVAQLLYLAYQVKTNGDERLIRVWAVTAVTPMAGIVETVRHNTIGFLEDYFILLDVREQNRRLKSVNDRLQLENIYYRNELATAEHAHALILFQAQSPSRTVAARVIGNSTVATAKAVFIDRGSTSGVEKGMAVVTPEGIVGKVIAAYPLVSQVLLVTDPTFKVGVESQKGHVHGVLNCGTGKCTVEQIQNEDKVDPGEWFFTSGEDRVFPRGFPVGTTLSSQPGQGMRDLKLNLSGAPGGVEEVLVVLQGVHQQIPTALVATETTARTLPPPPAEGDAKKVAEVKPQTEADKVMQRYDTLGKEMGHTYGALGSGIPNFNAKPAATQANPASATQNGTLPAAATAPLTTTTPPIAANTQTAATGTTAKPPVSKPPAILGSRPNANPPPAGSPAPATPVSAPKPVTPGPVLPLGAPRRPPAPKATDEPKPPAPAPQ